MANTIKRLKQYIDFKGITIKKFEEAVGFSNGAFSSQYRKNKTIGVDKLENILNIYKDINPIWLLTGVGEMILKNDFSTIQPLDDVENKHYKNDLERANKTIDNLHIAIDLQLQKIKELQAELTKLKDDSKYYKTIPNTPTQSFALAAEEEEKYRKH